MDTQGLPIFIPTLQAGSLTDTIYSVTMVFNGVTYQQYMTFIPQDSNNYYYVYTYEYLCTLINNCFISCLSGLQTACTNAGVNFLYGIETSVYPIVPIISYDTSSQLFTISVNTEFYGSNIQSGSNVINVYVNTAMQNLFLFNAVTMLSSATNGKNYLLICGSDTTSTVTQDYSTVGSISPILSIVFTSTQLPIIQNISGNPNIYINGTISNQNSSNTGFSILTDMVTTNFIYLPNIVYTPSGQYRYISMIPGTRIQNIDIQAYWLDKSGNLNQIYLNPGSCCTLKILFQKMY
jgi:hypothetical protein